MRKEKRHTPVKHSEETKNKIRLWNLGKKLSEETKKKVGDAHRREKSVNWKGENVGIAGLHKRIRIKWIKKQICEHCGKIGKTDWSNKDHKYKSENRKDWQEICRGCHIRYDTKFLGRKGRRKINRKGR